MRRLIALSLILCFGLFCAASLADESDFGSINLQDDGAHLNINDVPVLSRSGLTAETVTATNVRANTSFNYNGTSLINSTTDHVNTIGYDFVSRGVIISTSDRTVSTVATPETFVAYPLPWAGSIVGMSITSQYPISAGGITFEAILNNVTTGLKADLTSATGDTQYGYATQARDADTFTAGQYLGVSLESSSNMAPTGDNFLIKVYVEH